MQLKYRVISLLSWNCFTETSDEIEMTLNILLLLLLLLILLLLLLLVPSPGTRIYKHFKTVTLFF